MPNNIFWQYEYIPEIAYTAIPRELQQQAYKDWDKDRSKKNMNKIIRTFGKLINSEVGRYQGTLQRPLLVSFAKKYVTDAVRSFDPKSGNQLSTHIVNQLQRLHRLNYRNVQGLRSSEDVQRRMNTYLQIRSDLTDETGRDPTDLEISERMGIPKSFIPKMRAQIKIEKPIGEMQATHILPTSIEEKEVVDYLYYELPATHKKVMEYKTGYNNSPILSSKEIAKRLNMSPVRVTQISKSISEKLQKHLKQR